ncbi:MAG: hypothetical protein RIS44_2118 [Pseudomonadota bacterium]
MVIVVQTVSSGSSDCRWLLVRSRQRGPCSPTGAAFAEVVCAVTELLPPKNAVAPNKTSIIQPTTRHPNECLAVNENGWLNVAGKELLLRGGAFEEFEETGVLVGIGWQIVRKQGGVNVCCGGDQSRRMQILNGEQSQHQHSQGQYRG